MVTVQSFFFDNLEYVPKPDHRNNSPKKSQWLIEINNELEVFRRCRTEVWFIGNYGWGLYLVNEKAEYLGTSQDGKIRLFIAKFVKQQKKELWHGYPAYHVKSQDRPHEEVLNKWLQGHVLAAPKIRKISRGEKCKL